MSGVHLNTTDGAGKAQFDDAPIVARSALESKEDNFIFKKLYFLED